MRRIWILSLALLFLLPFAVPETVAAAELAGVQMADSAKAGDTNLMLNGMGLRKKAIFKVYVAGLYLEGKESNAEQILAADAPRRMVMEFVRDVSSGKLCGGWEDGLEANTPDASAEVKKQFEELCGKMSDVADDDRIVFTYLPGEGTEVEVKGQSQGSIPGKPFADALFSCWLGPEPPGEDMKAGLLGE